MALDNPERIREYRDQVADKAIEDPKTVVALGAGTMLQVLDALLEEIDRLQAIVDTGKENKLSSVKEIISLHQRRKLRMLPIAEAGPDLVE